jgi:CubicO group peptidase (beta-lactamase class C family)
MTFTPATQVLLTPTPTPLLPTETPLPPTPEPTPTVPSAASKIDAYLTNLEERNDFAGSVLVARGDDVLLAAGYGLADRDTGEANTPQTKFRICSVTKQFTAMAILILQDQGELAVSDGVCDHLPDCPEAWSGISLHHLLTHSSGIPDFVDLPGYEQTKAEPTTPQELISRFKGRPLEFAPGDQWRYSSSGYLVLGYIIELVSGQPYGQFIEERIFEPLGMEDSGYDHNLDILARGYAGEGQGWRAADALDASVPYAAGGLYSTVEDLYRWDQALHGERLVPQKLLDMMFTPFESSPIGEFGYGWIITEEQGRTLVRHGGGGDGFTSLIARYPEDRMVIILLSNRETTDLGSIWSVISREMALPPSTPTPRPSSTGTYSAGPLSGTSRWSTL